MTIRIIKPLTITSEMLVSASLVEDTTPEWVAGYGYAAGDEVHLVSTHRRYRSLTGSNLGNSPATATSQWLDIGPTNRWAPFDGALGSAVQTSAATLRYTLRPGQAVTAVALLGLQGAVRVNVVMRDGSTVVHEAEASLAATSVGDWYEYFSAPFAWRDRVLIDGLPLYATAEIEITITGNGSDPIVCAGILPGSGFALGAALAGVRAGWVDYSRAVEDAFGVVALVQRPRVPKLSCSFTLTPDEFGRVWAALESLASIPLVVSVSDDTRLDALTFYGWFREPQVDLRTAALYYCSLEFRGLTA
jgi:hypothetical protein